MKPTMTLHKPKLWSHANYLQPQKRP
jgi:hypothetical protein